MKVKGNERDYMLKLLKAKRDEGYTKEEIIIQINKLFSVDYKKCTYKSLEKEAERELRLRQVQKDEEIMRRWREQETPSKLSKEESEAERLYKLARGMKR
jgi:hypothetical protein